MAIEYISRQTYRLCIRSFAFGLSEEILSFVSTSFGLAVLWKRSRNQLFSRKVFDHSALTRVLPFHENAVFVNVIQRVFKILYVHARANTAERKEMVWCWFTLSVAVEARMRNPWVAVV